MVDQRIIHRHACYNYNPLPLVVFLTSPLATNIVPEHSASKPVEGEPLEAIEYIHMYVYV